MFSSFSSTILKTMKSKKIRPGALVLFFYKKITRFEPYEIIYSSDATLVWIVVV